MHTVCVCVCSGCRGCRRHADKTSPLTLNIITGTQKCEGRCYCRRLFARMRLCVYQIGEREHTKWLCVLVCSTVSTAHMALVYIRVQQQGNKYTSGFASLNIFSASYYAILFAWCIVSYFAQNSDFLVAAAVLVVCAHHIAPQLSPKRQDAFAFVSERRRAYGGFRSAHNLPRSEPSTTICWFSTAGVLSLTCQQRLLVTAEFAATTTFQCSSVLFH